MSFVPRDVPSVRDEVVRSWRSPIGRGFAAADMHRALKTTVNEEEYCDSEIQLLRDAELYWVSSDMGTLLSAARTSLPSSRLRFSDLPSASGFILFQTPITGIDAVNPDICLQIAAMEWAWASIGDETGLHVGMYENADTLASLHPKLKEMAEMVGGGSLRSLGLRSLYFLGASIWMDGMDLEDFDSHHILKNTPEIARKSLVEDRRTIHAFFLLIRQKVAAVELLRASRQMQRAAQRKNFTLPNVRVVNLRQTYSHGSVEGRSVEWSHRWLVSSHWRQQWHPSEGRHVPTLIPSHVKGPADKDLVVRPTVKAWRR